MIEFQITGGSVMIDDDNDWLMDFSWHINKQGYAVHFVNKSDSDFWGLPARKAVYLHRVVTGAGDSEVVDHVNHIRTDNRRDNLRICSQKENLRNQKSGKRFKGVFYLKGRRKCWQALIVVDGVRHYLGNFYSQEEAARAYNEAAVEYFGEFAYLNQVA